MLPLLQTDLGLHKHSRLTALSPSHAGSLQLTQRKKKRDIVDCHPFSTALTDDFLSHYVMELRASPALAWPVASVHTLGYERTGNAGSLLWGSTSREEGRWCWGVSMYTVLQYRFHFMYKTPEIVSSLALFVMSMTSAVKVGLCQIRPMFTSETT